MKKILFTIVTVTGALYFTAIVFAGNTAPAFTPDAIVVNPGDINMNTMMAAKKAKKAKEAKVAKEKKTKAIRARMKAIKDKEDAENSPATFGGPATLVSPFGPPATTTDTLKAQLGK